jgi:nitroreductase
MARRRSRHVGLDSGPMDTLHAIRTLRVVRRFSQTPLSQDELVAILDAGRHTGSSKNRQRWAFIAVTDRDTLRRLAEVGEYAGHLAGAAAAIALVTPRPRENEIPHSIMWDVGRAAQNMTLAAWAMGIGSVPATVYDEPLARSILGYPSDHVCEHMLSFGRPRDDADLTRPPRAGGRRSMSEIVHRERW